MMYDVPPQERAVGYFVSFVLQHQSCVVEQSALVRWLQYISPKKGHFIVSAHQPSTCSRHIQTSALLVEMVRSEVQEQGAICCPYLCNVPSLDNLSGKN